MFNTINHISCFISEIFSLKRIRRSSFQTLGSESGTIAEHSYCTAVIGYCLAKLQNADANKVALMCLFHDMAETRIGDANFVQKRYQVLQENKAIQDMIKDLPIRLKSEIHSLINEFEEEKTTESLISHEADKLEQLLEEKDHADRGNIQANGWMRYSISHLKLPLSRKLGKSIRRMKPGEWWNSLLSAPEIHKSKKS